MRDASLTDITCIEEMLTKFVKDNLFETEVFNRLWEAYLNFGRNFSQMNN